MCSSRYGNSSLIIKDIKYYVYILRSLILVILELLPQTLDSSFRVCQNFSIILPNFLSTFCGNAPPHGNLEKAWWYYLLDHDLFSICTKFHGNLQKNIEILEGETTPPPPLGLGDLEIAWALSLQIRCVKLCKVVYYMNHTTGLCGSYSTQLYTTFYTAYTTDLQCIGLNWNQRFRMEWSLKSKWIYYYTHLRVI